MGAANQTRDGLSFGLFHLLANERLLTKDGVPIELGSRALDILVALISAPNEVVSKRHLMSRVWPDVTVDDGSLRFHMVRLRKALGDGHDGARYIATIPGRGYCFVAPVTRVRGNGASIAAEFRHANLPIRPRGMVGREEDVLKITTQLTASHFVTIVGPGGIGKTTLATAVGHHLSEAFGGAALFVDLGALSDPELVATEVASMLGLPAAYQIAGPSLLAYLRDKRLLLILDTCEHLIDAVAGLAESVIKVAPQLHILATSREPLRAAGEHVYRLDALACPPHETGITAAMVEAFPATRLFIDRATASGARLIIDDAEARLVAGICRRLDGVALAIELAARRVESYGLRQTAALLDEYLTLQWVGSRTSPPRQRTLQATLDWSYALLTEFERLVLRRLAVFVGHFPLDAALDVVTDASLDRAAAVSAIDSLVAKSMVDIQPTRATMRYRLLDTTRAYALEIRIDDAGLPRLALRHADYYRCWIEQVDANWTHFSAGPDRTQLFAGLNNVRAALKWCFDEGGDVEAGIRLAAAAAPVFLTMSLLSECLHWSERAIHALDETQRGSVEEMRLQCSVGIALSFLREGSEAAGAALRRSVEIAGLCDERVNLIGYLGVLLRYHLDRADFKTALQLAKRARVIAETIEEPAAIALAHSMLGRALHASGDQNRARVELEASFHHWSRAPRASVYFARENQPMGEASAARTLWLQGHPAHAVARAHEAIAFFELKGHPAVLVVGLTWVMSVFLWAGDWRSAAKYIDRAIYLAESHLFGQYVATGRARKAQLAILRGDCKSGVETLRACLEANRSANSGVLGSEFNISLIQGLAALGNFAEAGALTDDAIRRVEEKGDDLYMPELLRLKGGIFKSLPEQRLDEAENCFLRSLELSRGQGARAWELRSATDLAAFWAGQGRGRDAHQMLQLVLAQFTEGFDTPDLKAAAGLIATLR